MISGSVRNREAVIELEVSGAAQQWQHVEAVIDTGFNGYLTLPDPLITVLQLPFAGFRRGTLADGSVIIMNMYLAAVVWHGRHQDVLVAQAAGSPLIGMSLLQRNRVTIDVIDGGSVTIEEMP